MNQRTLIIVIIVAGLIFWAVFAKHKRTTAVGPQLRLGMNAPPQAGDGPSTGELGETRGPASAARNNQSGSPLGTEMTGEATGSMPPAVGRLSVSPKQAHERAPLPGMTVPGFMTDAAHPLPPFDREHLNLLPQIPAAMQMMDQHQGMQRTAPPAPPPMPPAPPLKFTPVIKGMPTASNMGATMKEGPRLPRGIAVPEEKP